MEAEHDWSVHDQTEAGPPFTPLRSDRAYLQSALHYADKLWHLARALNELDTRPEDAILLYQCAMWIERTSSTYTHTRTRR